MARVKQVRESSEQTTSTRGTLQALLLCLFILAGFGALFLAFVVVLKRVFPRIDTQVLGIVVGGVATLISILLAKYYERKATIENDLRQKKVPCYEFVIATTFSFLDPKKSAEEPEVQAELRRLTRELIIWGSPEVLRAFGHFRAVAVTARDHPESAEVLFALERILHAIRADLGHREKPERGAILRLFINDIDRHLPGGRGAAVPSPPP